MKSGELNSVRGAKEGMFCKYHLRVHLKHGSLKDS